MIEAQILRLTAASGPGTSICPSDVARAVSPPEGDVWRQKLTAVRRAAIRLAQAGRIDILRKGKPVAADALADGVKGVIRLRIRPQAGPPAPE
nr:DUF3253 domain-containing protein [Limobrevibacterium gyesilva]